MDRLRVFRRHILLVGDTVLAVAVIVARVVQAATAPVFDDDFGVYRAAAVAAVHGASPWVHGFVYLPAALVGFLPLAVVPAAVAGTLWLAFSSAAVAGGAWGLARALHAPRSFVVAAVFLTFPAESALQFGNVTAFQFALLVAAVAAARAKRAVALGLLLGVGITLKPVLVVCLLEPVARRQLPVVLPAVAVPAVLSGLVLAGVGNAGGWLHTVRDGLAVAAADPASADLSSTLARLGLPPLASAVVVALVLVLAVRALLEAFRPAADPAGSLLVPLLVAFLFGSVAWAHYPLLVLPLLVERLRTGGRPRLLAGAAGVGLLLPEVLNGSPLQTVPPADLFSVVTLSLVLLLAACGSMRQSREQVPLQVG